MSLLLIAMTTDFISRLFHRGCFHVLEKIILDLDPDSRMACIRVSQTWKDIIGFFHGSSTNPRYLVRALISDWKSTCVKTNLDL